MHTQVYPGLMESEQWRSRHRLHCMKSLVLDRRMHPESAVPALPVMEDLQGSGPRRYRSGRSCGAHFNARTYPGYKSPDGLPAGSDLDEARLSHNGLWMEQQIAEDRTVLNIGPAEGRENYPRVTSDAYSVELYILESNNYPNVVEVPWP